MKNFNISTRGGQGTVVNGTVECNEEKNHFVVTIPQWELNLVLDKDQAGEYTYQHEYSLSSSKLFSDIIDQIELHLYQ